MCWSRWKLQSAGTRGKSEANIAMASQLSHGDTGTVNTTGLDRKPCLGLGKVYHREHRGKDQEAGLVNAWCRLLAKLMNRGLTEVTSSHPSSHLLGEMRCSLCISVSDWFSNLSSETIRDCLQRVLGVNYTRPKFQLTSEDYSHKETLRFDKERVTFTVYAPAVFATIQAAFGIGRKEFVESVAPERGTNYLK